MKIALVFGSSGLIGGHLLNQLIQNNNYSTIKLFVRSVPEINEPKVKIIKTDSVIYEERCFSASRAAIHPIPAAVTACLNILSLTSPAA
jgi:nucleoside-diphosphate-sugar epimerase